MRFVIDINIFKILFICVMQFPDPIINIKKVKNIWAYIKNGAYIIKDIYDDKILFSDITTYEV